MEYKNVRLTLSRKLTTTISLATCKFHAKQKDEKRMSLPFVTTPRQKLCCLPDTGHSLLEGKGNLNFSHDRDFTSFM